MKQIKLTVTGQGHPANFKKGGDDQNHQNNFMKNKNRLFELCSEASTNILVLVLLSDTQMVKGILASWNIPEYLLGGKKPFQCYKVDFNTSKRTKIQCKNWSNF